MEDIKSFNNAIQKYIQNNPISLDVEAQKHHKLPLSDAIFCAQDTARNLAFFQAIKRAIQDSESGPIVVDAGSGTGLLGAFALKCGAKKCYFLEHNPYTLEYSKNLLSHFGLHESSTLLECDATSVNLPEKYNILISETLRSGFVKEDFPEIINHLHQFAHQKAIILPSALEFTAKNKNTQNVFFYNTKQPIQRPPIEKNTIYTSKTYLYKDIILKSGDCVSFMNEATS